MAAECHCLPLRMVHRVVTGIYDGALRPFDLRIAQMNLLATIAKMGPDATPARLSGFLLIEKSTLSRDLERMAQRRWIKVADEGRARRLSLTTDGRRLLERALPAWETAQKDAEKLLGKATTEAIGVTAARLRTRLRGRP